MKKKEVIVWKGKRKKCLQGNEREGSDHMNEERKSKKENKTEEKEGKKRIMWNELNKK